MPQDLFKVNLPHTPSDLAQKLGIHVLIVGWYRFRYEYPEYYAEGMPGYDLIYSVSGKGWVDNGTERIDVQPGTLTIIDTYSRFGMGASPSSTWEFLYVHFNWKHFESIYRLMSNNGHTFTPRIPDVIENDFREIFRLKEAEDVRFEFISAQKIMNALGEIYSRCCSSNTQPLYTGKIDSVIQCIRENYMMPLSLSDLSKLSGYSSDYLNRIFKKYTHYTVNEYILKCQLEASKKLLINTSLSVKEIAGKVGFNSQAYFSRMFRQKFDMTPLEYKKSYTM